MMRSLLVKLLALSLVFFIAACGTDDDGPADEGTVGDPNEEVPEEADEDATASVSSIRLIANQLDIDSGSSEGVTLTAIVRDEDNVVVEDAGVRFSTEDSGSVIEEVRNVTDAQGSAEAVLTSPLSAVNRDLTVLARAAGADISDDLMISVSGTRIAIDGPQNLTLGESSSYTVRLRDSTDSAIVDEEITISSEQGNLLTEETVTTDSSGEATFGIEATVTGDDTLVASAEGVEGTLMASVSENVFTFVEPTEDQIIPINSSQEVVAEWTDPDGGVEGQELDLATSRGELTGTGAGGVFSDQTDGDGRVQTAIESATAGFATLTATTADSVTEDLSTSRRVQFVAENPDQIKVQALPRAVAPNSEGGTDNRATVTAIVRDADGNLVSDAKVQFSTDDLGLGDFSSATATSDLFGRATTEFIAGEVPTEFEGVTVQATVISDDTITDEVQLTVSDASFITVGTGGEISDEDPKYRVPRTLKVTNVDGSPAVNEEVSVQMRTVAVILGDNNPAPEGEWTWDGNRWQPPMETERCETEQFGSASLVPAEGTEGEMVGGTLQLITDDEGFADFDVVFPASEGSWSEIEILASADVGDTYPSQASFTTQLEVPIEVVEDEGTPPFKVSPYGSSGDCNTL